MARRRASNRSRSRAETSAETTEAVKPPTRRNIRESIMSYLRTVGADSPEEGRSRGEIVTAVFPEYRNSRLEKFFHNFNDILDAADDQVDPDIREDAKLFFVDPT